MSGVEGARKRLRAIPAATKPITATPIQIPTLHSLLDQVVTTDSRAFRQIP
jgi:hypothetical protein